MKDTILIATNGRHEDLGLSKQLFKIGTSYKVMGCYRLCIGVVPFSTHRIIYLN